MEKQRLFIREALLEIVALEQSRHADLGRNLDQLPDAELVHPFAVESHLGSIGIENPKRLRAIGLSVLRDLFASKRLAGLGPSGRIANHRGEVADQKNHGMAGVLEIAQLLEGQAMAEMQIRRGRIHAELDPERPAERNFRGHLGRRDHLDRAA